MENTLFFPIKKHTLNESGLTEEEKGKDKNQLKLKHHHVSSLSEIILALPLGSNKWADTLYSKP